MKLKVGLAVKRKPFLKKLKGKVKQRNNHYFWIKKRQIDRRIYKTDTLKVHKFKQKN